MVLLFLADKCDDKGENAFPSVATIGQACGMSTSTVQRLLRKLSARGLIEQSYRATQHRPTVYRVTPSRGVILTTLKRRPGVSTTTPQGCQPTKSRGVIQELRGVTAMTPDPSYDPSDLEPSNDPYPLTPKGGIPTDAAERARNGSRRQRDLEALEAEGGSRYLAGKYGAIIAERMARPDFGEILDSVATQTNTAQGDILGHSRDRQVSYARHLALFVAHYDGRIRIADLQRDVGDRDHSTIISGIKRIELELVTRPETAADLEAVRALLTQPEGVAI